MDEIQEVFTLFTDIYCTFFCFERISDFNKRDWFWIREINKDAFEKELNGSKSLLFIYT